MVSPAALLVFIAVLATSPLDAEGLACHTNCTALGNCNAETGECECPFGRTGPACDEDLLPSCRHRPDGNAYCGAGGLKSCACVKQCISYLCQPDEYGNRECESLIEFHGDRVCFERPGKQQQLNPPAQNETGVKYYKLGTFLRNPQEVTYEQAVSEIRWVQVRTLPWEQCPDSCNHNGACITWVDDPDPRPSCECQWGYRGGSCEEKVNVCVNECSGRGKCIDSWFCHCQPPYWGIGCGREVAAPPEHAETAAPHPVDFKIYMYDLPSDIVYQESVGAGWEGHDQDYSAYLQFINQLVRSPLRTEDPWQAHLFFIPALTYAYTSNMGDPEHHIQRVIDHVKAKFPFWERHGGRDHLVWTPGDRSSCALRSKDTLAPIKLTHFGYYDTTHKGKFKMVLEENWTPLNPTWGCYHPLRDVVLPPFLSHAGTKAHETYVAGNITATPRSLLLFFAGDIREDEPDHSGGARQELAKHLDAWQETHGDIISVSRGWDAGADQLALASKFCFVPYGHGFAIRIITSVFSGCVPVIIQEHVFQPFEDMLPYEEFSVRLNNADIFRLPELLLSVDDHQLAALQRGLERYWPAFVWQPEVGGRAFEYAALALRRRHMHHKSLYYGRHRPQLFR